MCNNLAVMSKDMINRAHKFMSLIDDEIENNPESITAPTREEVAEIERLIEGVHV